MDSLLIFRRHLASPTTYRFIPALSGLPVTRAYLRKYRQSAMLSPDSHFMLKPCRSNQHGFNSPAAFNKTNNSWTSFVDDVKRCFRGSAETAESGRGDYFANAFFA
jgi:hypothetical protein